MNSPFPAQTLVAVATVVAALIAGLISFVNLTLTKEQKTSEFRQAWIDGLREDLSTFLSAARACARAFEAKTALGQNYSKTQFPFSDDQVAELRHSLAQSFYKIKLRLNPDETEHIELLRLMTRALEEQNKQQVEQNPSGSEVLLAIERISDYARPVLKTEWTRVKRGELPFRVVRNWIAPVIVILCVVFIGLLINGRFGA